MDDNPILPVAGNLLGGVGLIILSNGTAAPEVFVEQLASRRVGVQVFYAGTGTGFVSSTQTDLPATSAISVKGSVNVIGANLFVMLGRSGP